MTARQQFWFDHLRGCAAQGKTLSTYAAEQGLSISAFQQAKSRRGLWPAAGPGFVRVQRALSTPAAVVPVRYQVSLPNGVVVVESARDDLAALLLAAARLP